MQEISINARIAIGVTGDLSALPSYADIASDFATLVTPAQRGKHNANKSQTSGHQTRYQLPHCGGVIHNSGLLLARETWQNSTWAPVDL